MVNTGDSKSPALEAKDARSNRATAAKGGLFMRDLQLIKIVFDLLEDANDQDSVLEKIAQIYNADVVDVTNSFLDYSCSVIDNSDRDKILNGIGWLGDS